MELTTHTELHDKWMRDEVYRKEYETELRKEDAFASAEITEKVRPNQESRPEGS